MNAFTVFLTLNILISGVAAARPVAMPTPTAAGETPMKRAPVPTETEDIEMADDDEELKTSMEGSNLPEPFFCEFRLNETKTPIVWVYVGSDYPRLSPPYAKYEVISAAYSRHSSGNGPSWGFCVEAEPTITPTDMKLVFHAHVSKTKSAPDSDSERCVWKSKSPIDKITATVQLKISEWGGIEVKNLKRETIRFSAHWPIKTQPDSDGIFCRDFAAAMNTKTFSSERFKKMSFPFKR